MPSVRIRENEYFDAALRRFKRACEKAGILTELRRREFYEKPTQARKRKNAAGIKSRKDPVAPLEAGGRADLVARESAEIALLQNYLPSPLSAAEIDALIAAAI